METLISYLSIDCVIFTFDTELKVLLVKHADGIVKDRWALPGGWIRKGRSINDEAHGILYLLTGLKDIYLDQFKTFGSVDRYPTQRVITVAYYSLIPLPDYELIAGYTASRAKWFSIKYLPELPFDHKEIFDEAIDTLQIKVKREPIIFNLLQKKFTLLQLQHLYESLLDVKFDKPNFRRKILKRELLKKCNEKQVAVSHRAAVLYEFDKDKFDRIKEEKFILDF